MAEAVTTKLKKVDAGEVPRGRGVNPFTESVPAIAARLSSAPGEWFLIGHGEQSMRSRLSNAAALLSGSKYKSISDYYDGGRFETRVSGAKDAPHADKYDIAVYARYLRDGVSYE